MDLEVNGENVFFFVLVNILIPRSSSAANESRFAADVGRMECASSRALFSGVLKGSPFMKVVV